MKDLSEIKNKGHWQVNGEQFDVKVNAILAAQKKDTEVTFHYNDRWWNQHNWAVEPKKSLEELYVERAKQLREKYKTLIVRFSGGSDSTNIMKTFIDNNIKIDVVVVNTYCGLSGTPWDEHAGNQERKLITWPAIQKFLKEGAEFEVIETDTSFQALIMKDDPDWIFKINAPRFRMVEVTAPRMVLDEKLSKYNNSDTAIVVGMDKPHVQLLHDKIWVSVIPDCLPLADPGHSHMIQEPFYWTADLPELPIKQNHAVKNWAKNNLDKLPETKIIAGTKNLIIPLIYGKYINFEPGSPLPFFDHSAWTISESPWDNLWDHNIQKTPIYDSWVKGIDLADSLIQDKFKRNGSIWDHGLKLVYTKPRWLGR